MCRSDEHGELPVQVKMRLMLTLVGSASNSSELSVTAYSYRNLDYAQGYGRGGASPGVEVGRCLRGECQPH